MSLGLPFQMNFVAFAIPGAIGALAVCFINVKHSHDHKAKSQQEEMVILNPIVGKKQTI